MPVGAAQRLTAAESEQAAVPVVIKRLDAQPIARTKEPAPLAVPDREGEHAPEKLEAVLPVFFICVQDGLGVAAAVVPVAEGLQPGAQRGMVVDLAVEDDHEPAVATEHRLMTGG